MAKTTDSKSIVLMDDELFNMRWLIDYLISLGFDVVPARSAHEAIQILEEEIYRCAILDLNVPLAGPLEHAADNLGDIYKKYPGLLVAKEARNMGYRDRQIIIYSVHRDPLVAEEAEKLSCTYILKGRPQELKEELKKVISYDPTDATS